MIVKPRSIQSPVLTNHPSWCLRDQWLLGLNGILHELLVLLNFGPFIIDLHQHGQPKFVFDGGNICSQTKNVELCDHQWSYDHSHSSNKSILFKKQNIIKKISYKKNKKHTEEQKQEEKTIRRNNQKKNIQILMNHASNEYQVLRFHLGFL